ncbi:MAG: sulfotransferase family 2 domain-containing protein [Rhizobiaceae bacterium]
MLIVSNRYRLATMLVPKCASTTLISILARLHDLPPQRRDRVVLDKIYSPNEKIDRHSPLIALQETRIAEAREAFGDYIWFAVVRDPYGRLLSNYHNKINRFCAEFRKDLYLRYKMVQVLQGPASWRDVRRVMPYLHSHVTYREFVETLQRHGVDWDRHFKKQSDILQLGEIEYTRLIRLESFQDELTELLRAAGVSEARLGKTGHAGRRNVSRRAALAGTPEDVAARAAVHQLYRDDFTRLGYAA